MEDDGGGDRWRDEARSCVRGPELFGNDESGRSDVGGKSDSGRLNASDWTSVCFPTAPERFILIKCYVIC